MNENDVEKLALENRRLNELLEDKRRELEHSWKKERELRDSIRKRESRYDDLSERHHELRKQFEDIHYRHRELQDRYNESTETGAYARLEAERDSLKEGLEFYEDIIEDIRRTLPRDNDKRLEE